MKQREGRERLKKRRRRDGGVQTEQTYRLVILGSSEQAMDSPAGTALPGLKPLQTDCSNLH